MMSKYTLLVDTYQEKMHDNYQLPIINQNTRCIPVSLLLRDISIILKSLHVYISSINNQKDISKLHKYFFSN